MSIRSGRDGAPPAVTSDRHHRRRQAASAARRPAVTVIVTPAGSLSQPDGQGQPAGLAGPGARSTE